MVGAVERFCSGWLSKPFVFDARQMAIPYQSNLARSSLVEVVLRESTHKVLNWFDLEIVRYSVVVDIVQLSLECGFDRLLFSCC